MEATSNPENGGRRYHDGQVSNAPRVLAEILLISVTRSTFHDTILGTTVWPAYYDGRAIVTKTYEDHLAGMSVNENTKRYNEAKAREDGELLVTWS
jgi:hypothetical protein